jgi:cytosine/adenosine deaminase-related metal-dependent hydrolase
LAAGGAIGVGTDSNILIDAAQEMRILEYAQRLSRHSRNVLGAKRPSTGGRIFTRALIGGAQALGQERVGLSVGAPADIVSLNSNHPSMVARSGDQILDSWIFAGTGGIVEHVWRQGLQVVENGRHRHAETVAARYRRMLTKLLAN